MTSRVLVEHEAHAGPLSGIRVVELGNYIAAPTAGRLLADFGAEVIKVERPGTGDELRNWRLYAGDTSLLFRTLNRNKLSVVLDLRTEEGRTAVLEMVETADIVLENFRPGTLERWGLGPEQLSRANPDIVITRISAYGQTGPYAERPGFAAVAEAIGGLRDLVGEPDRPPARMGFSIADSVAGIYAAFGAVTVMLDQARRRQDGRAPTSVEDRTVDVALTEAVLSLTESLVPDHLAYDVHRTRLGGRLEGIAPSNAYRCADDSWVVIAGNGDGIFKRLMAVIDRPDLADESRLSTNAKRWEHRDELDEVIGAWTGARERTEVLAQLETAGVPSGPINTAADICTDDQLRARGMIQTMPVDAYGDGAQVEVGFPGVVPMIGGRSRPIRSLGPDLGEHTEDVLEQLAERRAARSQTPAEEMAR